MIYVDSCIPMYLIGADHPNKNTVIETVARFIESHEILVTSAEAYQEIIHRYRALHDNKHLNLAYEAMQEITSIAHDVTKTDTDLARILSNQHRQLSSRDCLHVAIMKRLKCAKIWTFDSGFDEVSGIQRVG